MDSDGQPTIESNVRVAAAGRATVGSTQSMCIFGVLVVTAATLPLWLPSNYHDYILNLAITVLLSALGGLSFNLLGGFAGQVSFGHAAFFGISAYAYALMFKDAGMNPLLSMGLAAAVSSLVCIPIGLILFRLRGAYFALSMLAFAEITRLVAQAWTSVTNGAAGLLYLAAFNSKASNYFVVLALVVGSIVASWWLIHSKAGAYFLAIREDEDAAEALGIDTTRYKLIAFMVSAFMMGLAGAFYASYFAYLEPAVVFNAVNISLNVLIVTLIGGFGRLFGPLVGAAILVTTNEIFVHSFGEGNVLMSGILLIAFMLFLPEGLIGRLYKQRERGRAKPSQAVTADR